MKNLRLKPIQRIAINFSLGHHPWFGDWYLDCDTIAHVINFRDHYLLHSHLLPYSIKLPQLYRYRRFLLITDGGYSIRDVVSRCRDTYQSCRKAAIGSSHAVRCCSVVSCSFPESLNTKKFNKVSRMILVRITKRLFFEADLYSFDMKEAKPHNTWPLLTERFSRLKSIKVGMAVT